MSLRSITESNFQSCRIGNDKKWQIFEINQNTCSRLKYNKSYNFATNFPRARAIFPTFSCAEKAKSAGLKKKRKAHYAWMFTHCSKPLLFIRKINFKKKLYIYFDVPGVPTSFRQECSKKSLNVTKSQKNRESLFTV